MEKFLNEQEASRELKDGSMFRKRKTSELISQMKLSKRPIQNVTAEQINEELLQFVDPKGTYNYSQSYMNKIFSLLREVFKMAVVYEKLSPDANPFNIEGKIRKPRATKKTKKVTALNIEETKKLLQQLSIEEDKYKDVIWFLMLTGVRPGECLALKSKNCSLTENIIHIEVSLTKSSEDKTILGEDGKTENSERTIFITPMLREIIEPRINEKDPESLIFSNDGKLISVSTINRTFQKNL